MNLRILHRLLYQYSGPVSLDTQMIYLHPKTGPYLKVHKYDFRIDPQPSNLVVNTDIENNVQYLAFYKNPTDRLTVEVESEVETSMKNPFEFLIYPFENLRLPLRYSPDGSKLMHPYLSREGVTTLIDQFARQIASEVSWETTRFFIHLNGIINKFAYEIREEGDPYPPEKVLLSRKGSCRDYVNLYMALCRALGVAARFVSGYYLGSADEPQYLHAWAEVYLPGAGWRGFDPTQNCMVADAHIPLAASAIPQRVPPLFGTFRGNAKQSLLASVRIIEG